MNPTFSHYSTNQNQAELFEISLINKENRPLIKPSDSILEALTSFISPCNPKTLQSTSVSFPKSTKVYPLLWIDCKMNNQSQTQTLLANPGNIELKHIFERILSKSIKLPLENEHGLNSSSKKMLSAKKSFQGCSSSEIRSQTNQNNQINNKDLFIASKFVEAHSETSNSFQTKKIMLIHLKLFLNNKSLKNLTQELISLGSFLANDIIVNCTQVDKSNENMLISLIESLEQIIQAKKKPTKNLIETKIVHVIGGNLLNEITTKGKENLNFYRIKDSSSQVKVIQSLSKIKQKYLQSLDMIFDKQEEFTLKQFLRKYQIAQKILQNQSKKSLYFNDHLFNSQNVKKASEAILKEQNYQQERRVRNKLEQFYYSFFTDNKKCQLPLPQAIIKFKIQQVVRNELKDVTDKTLIEKVSSQYQKKVLQKNDRQIQKLLAQSIAQFLSSIFSPTPQSPKPQRQLLHLHPDKVTSTIRQFIQTIQSTHIFITQSQINKYIHPQMLLNYYKRLYQQYGKVKRFISGSQLKTQELIEELNEQVKKLRKENEDIMREAEIMKYCRKEMESQVEKYRKEVMVLRDELILWKDKYYNSNREMLDLVKVRNQLQTKIRDSLKVNNDKEEPQPKETQQKLDLGKLKFTILQQYISQSGNQQQTLTKSFQKQLNVYKNQYTKLQNQLKDKILLLDKKEQAQKQKISELQRQLFSLKSSSCTSFQIQLQNELWRQSSRIQIQTLYHNRLNAAKNQFEEKLQIYKKHISQLQQIKDQKNRQVEDLNALVYNYKRQLIETEDKVNQNARRLYEQGKRIDELFKVIEEKSVLLNTKTQDNLVLVEKLKQKNIRIQILQEDLTNLKTQLLHKPSTTLSNNLSFLKFQKDLIKSLSHSKPSEPNMSSSKLNIPIEQTPQKRVSRIKTVTEINENLELQILIQERRTIEKKKQRFNQQESLLQKMEHKLIGAKSQLKPNSKYHSLASSTKKIDKNTQNLQRVMKQSNRITSSKSAFDPHLTQSNISAQCRRKLF